jgi:hypothetical protein
MVQHSTDREPGVRQNHRFTDQSGSGNLNHRVNYPDVLCDVEKLSWALKQVKKHIVMVGSWSSMVSSELHING